MMQEGARGREQGVVQVYPAKTPAAGSTSFLARLLGSIMGAPHKKCVVFDGDHYWGVDARARSAVFEMGS